MFVRRPKIGEADDDLLAFQEEFLKQASGAPSAKVSRVGDGPQPAPVTPEVSSQTDEVKEKLMGVTPQPEQGTRFTCKLLKNLALVNKTKCIFL